MKRPRPPRWHTCKHVLGGLVHPTTSRRAGFSTWPGCGAESGASWQTGLAGRVHEKTSLGGLAQSLQRLRSPRPAVCGRAPGKASGVSQSQFGQRPAHRGGKGPKDRRRQRSPLCRWAGSKGGEPLPPRPAGSPLLQTDSRVRSLSCLHGCAHRSLLQHAPRHAQKSRSI